MAFKLNDLKPGDLLLKYYDGSRSNKGIRLGQGVFSRNMHGGHAKITHAALHRGCGHTIESQSKGLTSNFLGSMPYKYDVYRYNDNQVCQMAVEVAEACLEKSQANENFGKYNYSSGFAGFFRASNQGFFGKRALRSKGPTGHHPDGVSLAHLSPNLQFYCSAFVVFAYNHASNILSKNELPINADYRNVLPKQLQSRLNRYAGWTSVATAVKFEGQTDTQVGNLGPELAAGYARMLAAQS